MALARLFVEHGADVAVKDHHGRTPIHHAVERGSMDLVRLLVTKGVDTTAQDYNGQYRMGP